MGVRNENEVLFLRYNFSDKEKLEMANTLAANHNRMEDIEAEEAVFKTQVKEKKAQIDQSIQSLSRSIYNGWEMRNIPCVAKFDEPNVGEVTYYRKDTGDSVKTRVMTDAERQMDLPLAGDVLVVTPDKSAENIQNFFNPEAIAEAAKEGEEPDPEPAEEPEDPFTSDDPDAAFEAIKPEHDAEFDGVAQEPEQGPAPKPKAKRLRGFDGPTNPSAFSPTESLTMAQA